MAQSFNPLNFNGINHVSNTCLGTRSSMYASASSHTVSDDIAKNLRLFTILLTSVDNKFWGSLRLWTVSEYASTLTPFSGCRSDLSPCRPIRIQVRPQTYPAHSTSLRRIEVTTASRDSRSSPVSPCPPNPTTPTNLLYLPKQSEQENRTTGRPPNQIRRSVERDRMS